MLQALPSLVDITVPHGKHFTVCGDVHGQVIGLLYGGFLLHKYLEDRVVLTSSLIFQNVLHKVNFFDNYVEGLGSYFLLMSLFVNILFVRHLYEGFNFRVEFLF